MKRQQGRAARLDRLTLRMTTDWDGGKGKNPPYSWQPVPIGNGQKAYQAFDAEGRKVAVIMPKDREQPLEDKGNARLLTRKFRGDRWDDQGAFDLTDAKRRGDDHGKVYDRNKAAWSRFAAAKFKPFAKKRRQNRHPDERER